MKEKISNNFGLKLLAFLIAFLLWLVVVNIDDPIVSKTFTNIPVTVEHSEILTEKQKTYQIVDDTQSVNVVVTAKRRTLNKIRQEQIIVSADFKELYLDSQIPLKVSINGYEGNYEQAVTTPRNLQVQIEDNISKTCNITPVAKGKVRDGFILGNMKADPETVTINGPESLVEKISKVVAEVDVSGLSKNTVLDSTLDFYDEDGELIDQSKLGNNLGEFGVDVQVSLYRTKSVPLTVDVSQVEVKDGYSIASVKLAPEQIEVAGPDDALDNLEKIQVPASEFYGKKVTGKTDFTVDLTNYLPGDIRLADEHANNIVVTVIVERNGTKNFELPVGSITVKNLSDKLRMTYRNASDLEVHVRGGAEMLARLDMNKAASIDLKEYKEAGTYTVPVSIELPNGCGLESDVKVEIILEEKDGG